MPAKIARIKEENARAKIARPNATEKQVNLNISAALPARRPTRPRLAPISRLFMQLLRFQLVGSPCGQHGPYTFYRAFKYVKNGLKRVVKLSEFFFVKLWSDSDLVCIGELQLLWVDKNSEQVLSSLRLYFLPENTPEGRMDHGEDEVLAISEKVVLRLEDLITWITVDAEWTWGRLAKWDADVKEPTNSTESDIGVTVSTTEGSADIAELEKEQMAIDEKSNRGPSVVILSYPSYCRYRAMMKRLEGVEDEYLKHTIVKILGGFSVPSRNTRVLFCRDTFDYPELEGHELLCNHLAPKLKGRPRGRRKKRSLSPGSESNESESSICNVFSTTKTKIMTEGSPNGLRSDTVVSPRRSTRSAVGNSESKEFLKKLNAFMKSNHTPIGRIPSLGYRELDLHAFFTKVDKLGGYDAVTCNRLWKSIFDDLSGNYISTSAATVIRRHYERFLLPYERHLKGQEYKPSTSGIKRTKSYSGSGSDIETSESTSCSGNSTPIPHLTVTPILPAPSVSELKEPRLPEKAKPEIKTSTSLRSIRVKPDRLREQAKLPNLESINKTINKYGVDFKTEAALPPRTISGSTLTADSGLTVELITATPSTIPRKTVLNETAETADASGKNSIPSEIPAATIEKISRPGTFISPSSVIIQKSNGEKITTPAEGKENIATCNTNNISGAHNYKHAEIDLTEVPYKIRTPEAAHLDPEMNNSVISAITLNSSLLHTVKKRKLDILKEGGLEVTPVQPNLLERKEIKEIRPTVIHNPIVPPSTTTVGQLSITLTPDKQAPVASLANDRILMPPVSDIQAIPSTSIMRSVIKPTNKNITLVKNSPFYLNGQSPPKVVQSKSIYSYSEKTVYGNPKDYFMPPPRPPPQAPKFVETPAKQMGGEILDLTIKSPQKPVVEIMRVPSVASRFPVSPKEVSSKHMYKNSAALPVLDARVGSNLEITLVGPNSIPHSIQQKPVNKYNPASAATVHGPTTMHNSLVNHNSLCPPPGGYNLNNKTAFKRTFSGNFVANKKEENGRLPYPTVMPQQPYTMRGENKPLNNADFGSLNSYNNHRNSIPKVESSRTQTSQIKSMPPQTPPNLKPYATTPSSVLPGYFTQLSLASKMLPPYVPPIDPLYYSALQSLYPHNPLSSVPPFFPVPTPEQLQFYTDLMARNSHLRFPFPYPQDGNASVAANSDNNNFKKP